VRVNSTGEEHKPFYNGTNYALDKSCKNDNGITKSTLNNYISVILYLTNTLPKDMYHKFEVYCI